jgi:hypothetical protein
MTVETLAKLINLTIVGEIAVVSAVLVRVYPFPYLKRWAMAYGLSFAALSDDALAELAWEAAPIQIAELLLLAFSAQEFFFCARLVSGPAPGAFWWACGRPPAGEPPARPRSRAARTCRRCGRCGHGFSGRGAGTRRWSRSGATAAR